MRSIVLIAAVGLLVVGCGGESDTQAIIKVFEKLDDAQQRGDGDEACNEVYLVAEEGEEAEGGEEEGGEAEAEEPTESESACLTAFASAAAARKSQVRELHTTVESMDVEGDEATVTIRSDVTRTDGSTFTNTYDRDLVRGEEGWRIRISPEG